MPVSATEARPTGPVPVAALPVVNPADPGEHLPSQGRSLFEELFAVRRGAAAEIEVPFPFAALLARIDSQLQRDPASPLPPAKRVLIPLGRSLQRTAAAPDYFAYPRVLVAVDSPPLAAGMPLLKDRLYIGYQEQSAVIEIISYNEAAGRFEFQLLKDYRAGAKPRLVYANRSICFACHQNGSPIFSRALWDETNANAQVAATLLASAQSYYGIPPDRGIDVPYAIDNASERANGFALTQLLWRAGCGGHSAEAQGCRAGLFAAALRHALSSGQTWTPDARFMQAVDKPLREQARRRWPGGLSAGNPDIPNRNPLQAVNGWPAESAARAALAAVPARFDPLLPRSAGALWRPHAPDALRQLVAGLAEFVADSDRRQLESALARLAPPDAERFERALPNRYPSRCALVLALLRYGWNVAGGNAVGAGRKTERRAAGAADAARRHGLERLRADTPWRGDAERRDLARRRPTGLPVPATLPPTVIIGSIGIRRNARRRCWCRWGRWRGDTGSPPRFRHRAAGYRPPGRRPASRNPVRTCSFPAPVAFFSTVRRARHACRGALLRGCRVFATGAAGSRCRGAGSGAEQRRRSAAAQLSTLLRRLPSDRRDFSAEFSAG
jgi:hypothetical protein